MSEVKDKSEALRIKYVETMLDVYKANVDHLASLVKNLAISYIKKVRELCTIYPLCADMPDCMDCIIFDVQMSVIRKLKKAIKDVEDYEVFDIEGENKQ